MTIDSDSMFDGILDNCKSEYSHDNYIDIVDGKRCLHMDCSGFIHWLLFNMGYKRALVEARDFLRRNNFIKINRLYCQDFMFIHEHADKFKYWRFLPDVVEKCILVVVFPDGNGHCMFVDKIVSHSDNTLSLRVIDSTRYPHKNDTRRVGETGIGRGEIEITKNGMEYIYDSKNDELAPRSSKVYFVLPVK